MRRFFFKSMAALLMLSLAAGMPQSDALQAMRLPLTKTVEIAAPPATRMLSHATAAKKGNYYGSHPDADVFITQTVKHTCTLVAATMMIRNFACQRGTPYWHVKFIIR